VLMLSGAASPEERVEGLGLGADDYLAKPFHFPELVMRVRALAGRRPRAMPRVLRAGEVELDCLSRLARRQGRPLALSAKELAVLEALMAASPGYMSAEQLLEKAWDENADPFTKTVTVTIGRLRRKLGQPQVIETTVGVGYRLVGSPQALPINPGGATQLP
jgi:DNA-binding response OmpR family regulator